MSVSKMVELTEIMRQKNDKAFTELLNRIRTASHTEDDIKVIQSLQDVLHRPVLTIHLMRFTFGQKMPLLMNTTKENLKQFKHNYIF